MEKCFQEAVRYLGYGKNPVDEATSRLVEKGFIVSDNTKELDIFWSWKKYRRFARCFVFLK